MISAISNNNTWQSVFNKSPNSRFLSNCHCSSVINLNNWGKKFMCQNISMLLEASANEGEVKAILPIPSLVQAETKEMVTSNAAAEVEGTSVPAHTKVRTRNATTHRIKTTPETPAVAKPPTAAASGQHS